MAQAMSVTSPLGDGVLLCRRMVAKEQLGRLFEFRLELLSLNASLKLEDLLAQNVTVTCNFPDQRERHFNGDVVQFCQTAESQDRYFCYEAVLQPSLWFLTCTTDCRIFQQKTVPDIIKAVLDEHGITDVKKSLQRTYRQLEYCVQYGESDFHFISRLMELAGIYYYFEHQQGKHTLVLADSLSAHDQVPNSYEIPFMLRRDGYAVDHIFDWRHSQRVQSGVYVANDFDFERPRTVLERQSLIKRKHAKPSLEVYNYPGGYTQSSDGDFYSRTRIEELQAAYEIIEGKTNTAPFSTGMLFKLTGFHREDQNREHLITGATHELKMEIDTAAATSSGQLKSQAGLYYDCSFTAIDSQQPFRSPCITPKPVVRGPQTAMVVGKQGEEIWTDSHGRVKVQFHWDRLGKNDENSSCWLRVAQIWAGKQWGAMHIPRIGQEVIVDFLEGDPDSPIITGRVYNGESTVPYDLPANQTQSGLKSRSTKEGSGETFNELRFEDKKGEEEIYFHAEKNFQRIVENNDTLKVGFEKKDAGDQTIDIYNNRTTTLDQGNEKLQVKVGNRDVLIDTGNDLHKIAKGNRDVQVDTGNDTHKIAKGNRDVQIDTGNDTLTIKAGDQTVQISAGKSTTEAATSIELKVGGSSIKITPTSIEVKSTMIKLEATGSATLQGATTTVKGSASVEISGGMVKIN